MSKENFEQLLEESLSNIDMRPGAIVNAIVQDVLPDRIIVNAGLKSDAIIPVGEFHGEEIKVGDSVEVVIESLENGFGETRLSREKAIRAKAWKELETSHQSQDTVTGRIIERVKGGFTVELGVIRAFLPGSLVDTQPVRDPGYLEGRELEFKIIKMDKKRNNVVVSRKAVRDEETSVQRKSRLEELQEGQEVVGVIKNITDYGAFVGLGHGVDGLLHITDMAWKRVKHPSEILKVGQEVHVKVLKFDRNKDRVSLGMKQLSEDPWENIERRYPSSTRLVGHVTNIADYGCFVELEEGVEGLVHMSEMDWTNKNIHPSKVVKLGEEVEVMVLDIDEERRRISLGIKQCKRNPWEEFAATHGKDEKISGKIRSITDFGIFIGLDGGIDGLVHLSDISWDDSGEQAVRQYKKGDEVEAVILGIDAERERISLGIKQLSSDQLSEYADTHQDEIITAKVIKVEPKLATVDLGDEKIALMKIGDYSHDRIRDLREMLNENDEVDVKILNVDRKNQQIYVSHKLVEGKTEERSKRLSDESVTKATLGDLLKEQMKQGDDE